MKFDFLTVDKFSYLDIGGANFTSTKFDCFGERLQVTLFEPDPRSANALRESGFKVFEFGLSESEEDRDLYLTRKPECSSILKPNRKIIDLYPNADRFDVMNVCKIHCKALDSIEDLNVDFLKIDVQGHELPVLKGAREKLKTCLGLEVEVYFRPFYEGQPLFADIDTYLRGCGFELMDIKNQKYFARDGYYGAGELIFGDAVYVRANDDLEGVSNEIAQKLFMINYAYENYANAKNLISKHGEVALKAVEKAWARQFAVLKREFWLRKMRIIR